MSLLPLKRSQRGSGGTFPRWVLFSIHIWICLGLINCVTLLNFLAIFHFFFQSAERTLDAPDLVDDYYLNLLDWGSSNVLSIALGNTVYLWDASSGSTSELVTVDDDSGPVTSVSWAPDGRHIAVGLNSSDIQLWDSSSNHLVSF